jgi:hypothetical protein
MSESLTPKEKMYENQVQCELGVRSQTSNLSVFEENNDFFTCTYSATRGYILYSRSQQNDT